MKFSPSAGRKLGGLFGFGTVLLFAAACGNPDGTMTSPGALPNFDLVNGAALGKFEVCKTYVGQVGPAVIIDWTVDFGPGSNGAADIHTTSGSTSPLGDGDCAIVHSYDPTNANNGNQTQTVTVTERTPSGYDPSYILTTALGSPGGTPGPETAGDQVTAVMLSNNPDNGFLVEFINTYSPPPGGGEGCTPGYWKNHTGLKSQTNQWPPTGYGQGDSYDATFGVTSNYGGTLLQALNRGGGGEIALGRHAVAALLNSTHPDVSYDLSAAEVIAAVQAAYAGGDFEGVKNMLAWYNEQGCPIGN